jgi:hypothetical protein
LALSLQAEENMQWPDATQQETAQPKRRAGDKRGGLKKLLQRIERLARLGCHRSRGAVLVLRDLPLPSRTNSHDRLKPPRHGLNTSWTDN